MNREGRRKLMKTYKSCPWATMSRVARGDVPKELAGVLDDLAEMVKQVHREQGIDDMYLFIDKKDKSDVVVLKRNAEDGYTKESATGKIEIVPHGGKFDGVLGADVNVDFGTFQREHNILIIGNYKRSVEDDMDMIKFYDGQCWFSRWFKE